MHRSEYENFSKLILDVAEYYEKNLKISTVDVYWNDLRYYGYYDIANAIANHRRDDKNGKYMPKVSDILKYLKNAKQENQVIQKNRGKCAIESCNNFGTICRDIRGSDWICRKHYHNDDKNFVEEVLIDPTAEALEMHTRLWQESGQRPVTFVTTLSAQGLINTGTYVKYLMDLAEGYEANMPFKCLKVGVPRYDDGLGGT